MTRKENGLIEGLNYIRDEKTNKIDWFKTLPKEPEYIYINPSRKNKLLATLNKPFEEIKIDEVEESDLILTLKGVRWLLDTRGYKYVKFNINCATPEYAATTCEICFISNEDEPFEQIFCGSACANFQNTSNFATKYLLEISSNRALCRATRQYLNISAVSREELQVGEEPEKQSILSSSTQIKLLQDLLDAKKVSFKHLQERMKLDGKFDESYTSIDKLPKDLIFEYIGRLKAKVS